MTERLDELEATLEKHSGMDQQSARYYFYLEQEQVLKELQQQQTQIEHWLNEWQRLQVEEREIDSELKILEQSWQWQRTQEPQEFLHTEEWQQLFSENRLLKEQVNQLSIRSEIVLEQQRTIEAEINQLEATHPELLQSAPSEVRSKNKTPFAIIGGFFFLVGIFLPMPWKLGVFLLALGTLGYSFYERKSLNGQKSDLSEIKGKWQEKLGQLDNTLAQIEEINQSKNKLVIEQQKSNKKPSILQRSIT